ncbi:queuosine precursor transporter [Candidatus Dependentiae bacterium]|nr:queuosine precursor transporter [Candidatus Dependentiae bacterium]
MNELLFFLQAILVAGIVLGALVLGEEALVACISLLFVLANLFVTKQIMLFGFYVTSADVYIIGAVLGFNLLQEYFGREIARKAIWISFFISLVVLVLSQIHLSYLPNMYDTTQDSFVTIMGLLPRIVCASLVAHVGAQYVRLFFYGVLKRVCEDRYFLARNLVVTVTEQLVDTVIFGFVGLYGVVHAVTDVFVVSFTIKVVVIFCAVPWVLLAKKLVKRDFYGV